MKMPKFLSKSAKNMSFQAQEERDRASLMAILTTSWHPLKWK